MFVDMAIEKYNAESSSQKVSIYIYMYVYIYIYINIYIYTLFSTVKSSILTQTNIYTQSLTLLRSSDENKNEVRFIMVSLGYKNNARTSKFY